MLTGPEWIVASIGLLVGLAIVPLTRRLLRDRRARAGWSSPVVAAVSVLATALVFGLMAWRIGADALLVSALCFAAAAVPLAILDLATMRLPDVLVLPTSVIIGAVLLIASIYSGRWADALRGLEGAVALGVVFLVISVISRARLGLGDVKLAALIGMITAPHSWTAAAAAVVFGFVLAGSVTIVRLAAGGTRLRSQVPLGPYLIIGALGGLLLPLT